MAGRAAGRSIKGQKAGLLPVPRSTATYYCFVSLIITRLMLSLLSTITTNDAQLRPTTALSAIQHDHCESNAFIVVDHHDQWPWLESLLSTNMLFFSMFSMALFYIYLHMTFSRFIDKSVKGQGSPQRFILSRLSLVIFEIFWDMYIHLSLVNMNSFDSIFANIQFENVPIPHC